MSEHKQREQAAIYPGAPDHDETFFLFDSAVGKRFSIREATTEMLEAHARHTLEMQRGMVKNMIVQFSNALREAGNIAVAKAAIDYELDRRRRKGGLILPPGSRSN